LLLPRVNLFIADDVGLGKTIEAGLIARELLLRRKVRDIVVVAAPGILLQWKDELESRFGLRCEILDKTYVARVRQERGWAVNPWATHSRFLISHRLLVDEFYAGPLRDWLGELRPGSLLILDEAHHAAPASGAKYAIDSKFTRAVRDLAGRFEHRLFLSATPHNGHSNSFSALLEILDPQRFCRGVPVRSKKLLDDVLVRRLKEDLREVAGGFPKREVLQVDIDGLPEDAPELRLSGLLDEYRCSREERLKGLTRHKRAQAAILISGLQQRLLSSIEAFARTLRVHRKTVLRHWEEFLAHREIEKAPTASSDIAMDLLEAGVGSDDERAELPEEDLDAEVEAQFETAATATKGPLGGIRGSPVK
jgi:SNF2 family DNA or RNA helicase